jgi:pimeloyl-ACP methyl ester carboxylesterase
MKEGYLKSKGYRVHYVEWGEEGPKVLLLHSMGMDGHSMDELAEDIQKDYQVLSLTLLGHGDSDCPEGGISLPDHAEVIRDCYLQRGFYPSVLIGHSVGGMMGMILAADHSDEVKGLILVDIAPFQQSGRAMRPEPPESFKDEAETLDWLKERYPGFTDRYYVNRIKCAFTRKGERLIPKPRGESVREGLAIDLWPYVERINVPTLMLIGKNSDLVTPETRTRMEKTIKDLEAFVVKGTGHMIPQEKPEEFSEHVRRFLKKVY